MSYSSHLGFAGRLGLEGKYIFTTKALEVYILMVMQTPLLSLISHFNLQDPYSNQGLQKRVAWAQELWGHVVQALGMYY